MAEQQKDFKEFVSGLQSLADSAFPRKCVRCGRVFQTMEEFARAAEECKSARTEELPGSEGHFHVELYRNCPCGSTLLQFFSDRRDCSSTGLRRREQFGRMLEFLEGKFRIHPDTGRMELLKILHGQQSPLLQRLGLS